MSEPITYYGAEALSHAAAWLREQGVARPLVLSGASGRFVEELSAQLSGMTVEHFAGAQAHVPRATVDAAQQVLARHEADALITVGGGSATGLGKALRLHTSIPLVSIPTTYAGSEMTRIYGITEGNEKQTGRDDRVRPDVVAYVPDLLDSLPRRLTVQSLLNAMAHPVSALSTGTLDDDAAAHATAVIVRLLRATARLANRPRHRPSRVDAARGASEAAAILDRQQMGMHHKVVHLLGGRLGLPHAPLHAVLLPASLAALGATRPQLLQALPDADPLALVFDVLVQVGAPTSVASLDVDLDQVRAIVRDALGDQPWVEPALVGRRPSVHVRWQPWGRRPALSVFGSLPQATDVVLAVHGRGSTADAIVQRAREIVGDAAGVAVVAPQAEGVAWSHAPFRTARADDGPGVAQTIDTLWAARAWAEQQAPHARVHLLGFSQGACMCTELIATSRPFASVIALGGARVGPAESRPPYGDTLRDVPVLLGIAQDDRWVTRAEVEDTAEEMAAAGAKVELLVEPGDAHEISGRQRIRARELITGRSAHQGGHGFGNVHASEALPGALPRTQNSPRRAPYGLYAEQWNGTGFIADRHHNLRTWVYRLRPAAGHRPFEPLPHPTLTDSFVDRPPAINLVGFRPLAIPEAPTDFVDGLHTFGGQGRAAMRRGFAIHLYVANRSMEHRAFQNADGDLLILPQLGALTLRTELGILDVAPGQIAIVPRGIAFSVLLHGEAARGYVGEIYGRHFELPDRGVVGANGLTDERHFRVPSAWFEDRLDPGFRLTTKLGGVPYQTTRDRSPFDVVAWHGNYVPYVYDLAMFSPITNAAFDHIDPSAHLVVSAPLDERGADSLDLVVFTPRWDVAEHTFRPPFFHRNAVTEFNGIVRETPHPDGVFDPGAYFLTPTMTAHGVRSGAVESALSKTDEQANAPRPPSDDALWFQLETALQLSLTKWAENSPNRVEDWSDVWGRYRGYYDPHGTPE